MPLVTANVDETNGALPITPKRSGLLRAAVLTLLLLVLRVVLLDHPTPVHPDEEVFVAAIGFPAPYPVHHPGYPLWVALGTLGAAAGLDAYAAYQVWSVLASVAMPVLLYRGLRRTIDDTTAWWLAAALGVNPLVWFCGTTALSYAAAGAVGLLVVGLCWQALQGHPRSCNMDEPRASARAASRAHASLHEEEEPRASARAASRKQEHPPAPQNQSGDNQRASVRWAAVVFVLGVSLRADILIYLGPMLAYTLWRCRRRGGIAAAVIAAAGCAACFALTAHLYSLGGTGVSPVGPSLPHTLEVIFGTSVFHLGLVDGLLRNAVKIGLNLGWDFGAAVFLLPPAILHLARRPEGRSRIRAATVRKRFLPPKSDRFLAATAPRRVETTPKAFLLIWSVPALVFLLSMHVAQGYFMLLLPAGYCLIGLALHAARRRRTAVLVAAAVATCSLVQFALYPWSAESTGVKRLMDAKIAYLSASGLRQIDRRPEIHTQGDFWPTAAHGEERIEN